MLQILGILSLIFLLTLGSFLYVLFHERRTLWAGMTFTATLAMLAILSIILLMNLADKYSTQHQWLLNFFIWGLLGILLFIVIFVFVIIAMLIYNGIKLIYKEGNHWTNYLSLGLGIFLILFLFIYPNFSHFYINDWITYLYIFLILVTLYFLYIMVMYVFTAWVNLINHKTHNLDYVVVLGSGLLN